jgi:hypothetical protein
MKNPSLIPISPSKSNFYDSECTSIRDVSFACFNIHDFDRVQFTYRD